MDLNVILRTSLLLAAAGIIARLLRHAAPSTRHLLWHTAIVLVLLAPALAPLAPTFEVPMVRTVPGVPMGLMPTVLEAPMVSKDTVPDAGTSTPGTLGTNPLGTLGTFGTLGVACAIPATRLLRGLLFQVGPHDPVTFALIGSALTVVAVIAAYLPARRGTSADPVVTLKAE